MKEISILVFILITIGIVLLFHKIYNKRGLIYTILIFDVITYLLTFKISIFFNSNINIGIIPLIGMFSIIYFYLIRYGKKDYNQILNVSLLINITIMVLIILLNIYIPSITDNISLNMYEVFIPNIKLLLLYPIIIYISEYTIEKLYTLLIKVDSNKYLSIILTYIITSIIYTIIYYLLAYIKVLLLKESLFLGISTYILGLLITIIYTGIIYLITKKKVRK